MAQPLIFSTNNQTVVIGPFCNSTDGVTPLTSLTITNNDIKIYKHGATATNNLSAGNATHVASGYYYFNMMASDTGTYGRMRATVNMNGSVPVWEDFSVMNATIFSVLHGNNAMPSSVTAIADNTVTAAAFNQAAADKVWATAGRTLTGAANITTNNNKITLHTDDKVLLAGTTHTSAVIPVVTAVNNVSGSVATVTALAANSVNATSFAQNAADKIWSSTTRELSSSNNIFSANAITASSFNQAAADKVWATAGRTLTSAANITTNNNKLVLHTDDKVLLAGTTHTNAVVPTVSTLTGHTAQTGDTFALANGVAGFVAINADVEAILADTDELQTNQGDWATATGFSTHSAADVWGATNATLSLTYAVIASRLYRFLCNRMNITDATGGVVLYDEAGSGTIATQSITDDSTDTLRTALSWA